MSGYILLAAISIAVIGICVWLWGCTGSRPKPQLLVDAEIQKAREEAFIERALR